MGSGFNFNFKGLETGLTQLNDRVDRAVRMYAEISALQLQNDARDNARWTDRTGHARQRLTGDVIKLSNGYKLRLAHGVDYGVWLELANEQKFAIIQKTIWYDGQFVIMPGFNRLMERI